MTSHPRPAFWTRLGMGLLALVAGLLLAVPARAADAGPLRLDGSDVDAWPYVTVLHETDRLSPAQALDAAHQGRFRRPDTPHANLGVVRHPVWLYVPLQAPPAGPRQWIASIDYPSLDEVEAWLVDAQGHLERRGAMGDQVPAGSSLHTRSLALPLPLAPGQAHALLLRVTTTSTMIVPLRLMPLEPFHASESAQMLQQGLLAGVATCLFMYSLLYGLSTREVVFFYYAGAVVANLVFFFAFHGVGALHLWGDWPWFKANAAPAATLMTVTWSALFMDRVLGIDKHHPRMHRALLALAAVCVASDAMFATGIIEYRTAQLLATVTGCLPMVFALPASMARARAGDRAARFLVTGWMFYGFSIGMTAGLLRGWTDAEPWVIHSLQYGATLEMMTWLLVLATRTQATREAAEVARRERDLMHALAQTDVLTGLLNRRGLMNTLDKLLGTPAHHDTPTAVFLLDLDGFKPVNDRLGHDAGDVLLQQVAQRLRAAVRTGDVVARLGGDEFVVVAPGLRQDRDTAPIGAKLLSAFEAPFVVEGESFRVGATIGCATSPREGRDADTLLRVADAAMYRGKQAGKARLVLGPLPA